MSDILNCFCGYYYSYHHSETKTCLKCMLIMDFTTCRFGTFKYIYLYTCVCYPSQVVKVFVRFSTNLIHTLVFEMTDKIVSRKIAKSEVSCFLQNVV